MCIKASIKFVVNWVLNDNKYRLNGNKGVQIVINEY